MTTHDFLKHSKQNILAFGWGSLIGVLGGLIGLGGAEFRLPALVGIFKFRALKAITVNLIVSLVTVVFSFVFRAGYLRLDRITANWHVVLNLLAGSLLGAYVGAHFAASINERVLHRVVVVFLIALSGVLMSHSFIVNLQSLQIPALAQIILGFTAGAVIGIFSSMLGVAGGELIIPTIVLLFALDIKLAGSLSLAVSVPTILMGLVRYGNQGRLADLRADMSFIVWMSLGSMMGALIGSYLLQFASGVFLHALLGLILLISALKLMREQKRKPAAA